MAGPELIMPILAIPLLLLLPLTATAALAEERARLPARRMASPMRWWASPNALELAGVAAILAGVLWAVRGRRCSAWSARDRTRALRPGAHRSSAVASSSGWSLLIAAPTSSARW